MLEYEVWWLHTPTDIRFGRVVGCERAHVTDWHPSGEHTARPSEPQWWLLVSDGDRLYDLPASAVYLRYGAAEEAVKRGEAP